MDTIIRMIAKDAPIKAMAIQAKGIVERAREIHKTLPVATAALGRTLMAASMMGQQIKEKDGSVTLRINGGGPLGSILAVSDSDGNVRGYVQNGQVELPLKTVPVEYRCYCSRDRMRRALISMGKQELTDLIREQGRAEMTCQFCDAVHVFEKDELEALAASL